jgi:hypothetical protein
MAQKQQQHQPVPLTKVKGWAKDDKRAYRRDNTIIVEKDQEVLETIEITQPSRDFTAKLYQLVK